MVDYVVEEATGRPMSADERGAELVKAAEKLCARAVKSHKNARKAHRREAASKEENLNQPSRT